MLTDGKLSPSSEPSGPPTSSGPPLCGASSDSGVPGTSWWVSAWLWPLCTSGVFQGSGSSIVGLGRDDEELSWSLAGFWAGFCGGFAASSETGWSGSWFMPLSLGCGRSVASLVSRYYSKRGPGFAGVSRCDFWADILGGWAGKRDASPTGKSTRKLLHLIKLAIAELKWAKWAANQCVVSPGNSTGAWEQGYEIEASDSELSLGHLRESGERADRSPQLAELQWSKRSRIG